MCLQDQEVSLVLSWCQCCLFTTGLGYGGYIGKIMQNDAKKTFILPTNLCNIATLSVYKTLFFVKSWSKLV